MEPPVAPPLEPMLARLARAYEPKWDGLCRPPPPSPAWRNEATLFRPVLELAQELPLLPTPPA